MYNASYLNQTYQNVVRGYKEGQKIESNEKYTFSIDAIQSGKTAGVVVGVTAKVFTAVGMAVSLKFSLALLKLFQMLEFLTLFSIRYPDNVKAFLLIFEHQTPLKDIPNPFKKLRLYNTHCQVIENKFVGEEIDCQLYKNSGGLLALLALVFILKLLLILITKLLLRAESKVKNKLQRLSKTLTSHESFYLLLRGLHLDIYLSILTNFTQYKQGDSVADINIFSSMVLILLLIFLPVFYLFKTSKVLESEQPRKQSLKKLYKNYAFLTHGIRTNTTFSAYYRVLDIIKDPLIAFAIILLDKKVMLQVLVPLVIFLYFSLMEISKDPIENRKESIIVKFTRVLFLIIMSLYMVLVFQARSMNSEKLNMVYGYPIIGLYTMVIVVNIAPIVLEMKDKIVNCFKKKNKQIDSKSTKQTLNDSVNEGLYQNSIIAQVKSKKLHGKKSRSKSKKKRRKKNQILGNGKRLKKDKGNHNTSDVKSSKKLKGLKLDQNISPSKMEKIINITQKKNKIRMARK